MNFLYGRPISDPKSRAVTDVCQKMYIQDELFVFTWGQSLLSQVPETVRCENYWNTLPNRVSQLCELIDRISDVEEEIL